eukprot:scaffold93671_cov63-Phaeocystis_antarctica.AAC.2
MGGPPWFGVDGGATRASLAWFGATKRAPVRRDAAGKTRGAHSAGFTRFTLDLSIYLSIYLSSMIHSADVP